MAGSLVNAFGKITLDENSRDVEELLGAILLELRIINVHLAMMTDDEVTAEDVERYGE